MSSWCLENSSCSFERTRSECYTGAIMTVPPELPPGTLRCSAFLVGMDRTAAAIPFSSDVACYPRIHVSESGDEPTDISRGCCTRPALCTCCIVRRRERLYRHPWGNSRTFPHDFVTSFSPDDDLTCRP